MIRYLLMALIVFNVTLLSALAVLAIYLLTSNAAPDLSRAL